MTNTVVISDNFTLQQRRIAAGLSNKRGLVAACGQRFVNEHRDHFEGRNREANKRGWPKRNFWNRIRGATKLENVTDRHATMVVSDPALNLKVRGGTVRAKRGKYLTIPANADAYRAGSPREGIGDRLSPLIRYRNGRRTVIALVENAATNIRISKSRGRSRVKQTGTVAGGRVMYWLKEAVTMRRDPKALPNRQQVEDAVAQEAGRYLDRQFNPGRAGQ